MKETLQLIRRHLREMWYRRWVGLLVAWLAALLSVAVVYRIPERFEASARVFVDTESILKPLLAGLAIPPNVQQQVGLMSRTLISRPNVEKVVRSVDLDLRVQSEAEREALIENVMKSIKLGGSSRENLYVISYLDTDPEQARKVVQALLTIFVESSVGDKRQDSRTAARFLDEQIKRYEEALNVAENRLKEFRLRNLSVGSREGGDYFSRMEGLSQQIAQARLELDAIMQTRDAYRRELSGEQPTFIADPVEEVLVQAAPEIDARLAQLKKELDELTRKYTDNHPDVVATKRLIAELETQRKTELDARRKAVSETPSKGGRPMDRNPVFQQLRISVAEAEAQVAAARSKLGGLEGQLAQLRSQAKMVPQMEAELSQLNRDYDVQKKTYESLLARRESAAMGIGMQDTSGAQFRVIDPPRVSPRPVAPNRLALIGVALLFSIGAGIVASFVASQVAPTFHDARSLRESTNRPVLGLVSELQTPGLAKVTRRRSWLFAGGVSGLLAMFAAVGAFAVMMWRVSA
jgi:polysaccharide chain length determinant protein (PEP-CTERM system associated)